MVGGAICLASYTLTEHPSPSGGALGCRHMRPWHSLGNHPRHCTATQYHSHVNWQIPAVSRVCCEGRHPDAARCVVTYHVLIRYVEVANNLSQCRQSTHRGLPRWPFRRARFHRAMVPVGTLICLLRHATSPNRCATKQDHDGLDFNDTDLLGQFALLAFGSVHDDGTAARNTLKRMLGVSDRTGTLTTKDSRWRKTVHGERQSIEKHN